MKKIAAVLGLLMLLCSITACDSFVEGGQTQCVLFPSGNSIQTDVSTEEKNGETADSENVGTEEIGNNGLNEETNGAPRLPIAVIVELDRYEYSFSDNIISVPVYYGTICDCAYWKGKPSRVRHGEVWLGIHRPEENYLELLKTISSEELDSCEYCFKSVYGTGKFLYPLKQNVDVPMSLLTTDEGAITISYFLINDLDTSTQMYVFVNLYYRKTNTGIEIYDVEYSESSRFFERVEE